VSFMTRRRLEWCLRARGTDLASWPEAERAAALSLLRRSRAAQAALAEALAAEDAPMPDPAALRRMQGVLRRHLAPRPAVVRGIGWGALAACAAAGLYLGVAAADPDPAPDLFASAQTVTFASLDQ